MESGIFLLKLSASKLEELVHQKVELHRQERKEPLPCSVEENKAVIFLLRTLNALCFPKYPQALKIIRTENSCLNLLLSQEKKKLEC